VALFRRRLRAMERELDELGAAVIAVCDAADADRLEAANLRTRMTLVERLVTEQHRTIIETNESLVSRLSPAYRSTPLPPPPPPVSPPVRPATTASPASPTPQAEPAQPLVPAASVTNSPAASGPTSSPSTGVRAPIPQQASRPATLEPASPSAALAPAASLPKQETKHEASPATSPPTSIPIPTEAADGTLTYLRDVSESLVRSTAHQAVSMDVLRTRQDHLEGRIEAVDQSVDARIAVAQAATANQVDQQVRQGLDELHEARVKMAAEQARFEIATHDEIAAVIDRYRASR
jgi:hypothetical protein